MTTPAPPGSGNRAVWIGFALIVAFLVGASAGLLAIAGGVSVPFAVLGGGAAFAGTIHLVLALVRYAVGDGT